jgi:hypothetical protein
MAQSRDEEDMVTTRELSLLLNGKFCGSSCGTTMMDQPIIAIPASQNKPVLKEDMALI